ncbi:MAG: aminopeptidase [Bacteroidia bacterium]|nr:aminopeptidase [Bacteroidia bacterium]
MIRKIIFAFIFLLAVLIIWNWSLLLYGINQGIGQLNIVWNARPVNEYLLDSQFPDSLKSKLLLIDEVRKFAIDSLGLKDTDNYKTLYDQKGEELMWVVTACAPFELKPKLWTFPVIGDVPYKGYFDKEKARKERDQLEIEGWDVSVMNPGGWSTLGWFTDPILSGMLTRSEGDLASLIIHEMVHATFFVKDSVELNENLASFIGDTTAYDFLRWKFGADSKEYVTYLHEDQDYRKYYPHVLRGTNTLDSLYEVIRDEPINIKKEKKEEAIRKIVESMDTLTLHTTRKPSTRYQKRLPNNTYFMSYRRYQSKQLLFKDELEKNYKGDIKNLIRGYQSMYPFL